MGIRTGCNGRYFRVDGIPVEGPLRYGLAALSPKESDLPLLRTRTNDCKHTSEVVRRFAPRFTQRFLGRPRVVAQFEPKMGGIRLNPHRYFTSQSFLHSVVSHSSLKSRFGARAGPLAEPKGTPCPSFLRRDLLDRLFGLCAVSRPGFRISFGYWYTQQSDVRSAGIPPCQGDLLLWRSIVDTDQCRR